MAGDPVVAKYQGKFMDESGNAIDEDGGCAVEFYMEAVPDQLLTDGGEIERRHPKVKEIQKREAEALALLRQETPFTEEAPPPAGAEPAAPPADAPEPRRKQFAKDHASWEAAKRERTTWEERRDAHEADLKEKSRVLREHPEHAELFTVLPAGRGVFTDMEFIQKRIPGDLSQVVQRRVRESDRREYPDKYRRFKSGQAQATTGTPLDKWPGLLKSQVLELNYFGVKTVEQLAQVSDDNLSRIGPYVNARQKAKDWIATARGNAPIDGLRAEIARRDNDIETLKKALTQQGEKLAELSAKQAR